MNQDQRLDQESTTERLTWCEKLIIVGIVILFFIAFFLLFGLEP